jgi:adenosylcobinamide amidohydrolase
VDTSLGSSRATEVEPTVHRRTEDGHDLPFLVWSFPRPQHVLSSASVGGGLGERDWIINAQVVAGYGRVDLHEHVAQLAGLAGLPVDGPARGVGLLTAADVSAGFAAHDSGLSVHATVGIREPTWAVGHAASSAGAAAARRVDAAPPPGTINIVAVLPVACEDAALVNLALTATEAKVQALVDAGVPGTGTVTDSVTVACTRAADTAAAPVRFGGPRSVWGERLARAVHAAIVPGIAHSRRVIGTGAWDDVRSSTNPVPPSAGAR